MTASTCEPTSDRRRPLNTNPALLVGLDGGSGGVLALEWALAEAIALGVPVTALTAWSWDARLLAARLGPSRQAARIRDHQQEQVAVALLHLAEVDGHDPARCRIETELVEGDPASTLVERSGRARLLVLGSRPDAGHSPVGSVARACLGAARCPVVVVPGRVQRRTDSSGRPPFGRSVTSAST